MGFVKAVVRQTLLGQDVVTRFVRFEGAIAGGIWALIAVPPPAGWVAAAASLPIAAAVTDPLATKARTVELLRRPRRQSDPEQHQHKADIGVDEEARPASEVGRDDRSTEPGLTDQTDGKASGGREKHSTGDGPSRSAKGPTEGRNYRRASPPSIGDFGL